MSTFATVTLACPSCGRSAPRRLAESANAARHPPFRAQVLAGTFMRFVCEACGAPTVIERELLYTDLPRGQLVGVFPASRRADGLAIERGFVPMLDALSAEPGLAGRTLSLRRIVFGYAELREKLVCADAGLDDRAVEALKLVLLARTGWVREGSHGLLLIGMEGVSLVFEQIGVTMEAGGVVHSHVPRGLLDDLSRSEGVLHVFPIPDGALWVSAARAAAEGGR